MEFEWDTNKNDSNLAKHGISFLSAAGLLAKPHYRAQSNRNDEIRYLAVGEINSVVITVVYTIRSSRYRLISARRARKDEEAAYRKYCTLQTT